MRSWTLISLLVAACGAESQALDVGLDAAFGDASFDARVREDATPTPDGGRVDSGADAGPVIPMDASLDVSIADAGTPAIPNRLVIVYVPHGIGDAWRSTGEGSDYVLSEVLAPLRPFQNKTIVVDGLDLIRPSDATSSATHSWGPPMLFTGRLGSLTGVIPNAHFGGGPSLDQVAAADATTIFRSIELGVSARATTGHEFSFGGADDPLARENDPRDAFERLFRSLDRDDPNVGEVTETLESGLNLLPPNPTFADGQLVTRLQFDIIRGAFITDITRVASLRFGAVLQLPWLGIAEPSWHEIAHDAGDPESARQLAAIWRWFAEQVADFAGSLDAFALDDGTTLLDHTLIVFVSETGRPDRHSGDDIPVVIVGNAGGGLVSGQRIVVDGTQVSLLLTLVEALGITTDAFDGLGGAPIDALLRR